MNKIILICFLFLISCEKEIVYVPVSSTELKQKQDSIVKQSEVDNYINNYKDVFHSDECAVVHVNGHQFIVVVSNTSHMMEVRSVLHDPNCSCFDNRAMANNGN